VGLKTTAGAGVRSVLVPSPLVYQAPWRHSIGKNDASGPNVRPIPRSPELKLKDTPPAGAVAISALADDLSSDRPFSDFEHIYIEIQGVLTFATALVSNVDLEVIRVRTE